MLHLLLEPIRDRSRLGRVPRLAELSDDYGVPDARLLEQLPEDRRLGHLAGEYPPCRHLRSRRRRVHVSNTSSHPVASVKYAVARW